MLTLKDGVAYCLTELGGSPESRIKAVMGKLVCSGDASLQNGLDLVHSLLNQIPSYGHHEVFILYSALSKSSKIRCSVIGLSAELSIYANIFAKKLPHLKELVLEHAPPPPAIAEFAIANLIKMEFPQRAAEGVISFCSYHKEAKFGGGYTCRRCKASICELSTECCICGLTLVSSPHFARSYHHLFPITPFGDVAPLVSSDPHKVPKSCFGCQQSLLAPDALSALFLFPTLSRLMLMQETCQEAAHWVLSDNYPFAIADTEVSFFVVQIQIN
ncbi:unnamed protein product [Fraxinus pennsylvanica]|uniref:Ssl1-like domain-containing protein n=1 Tax=Fraxinus pennsylvanica TaxID=56036 RepID=A0AAD2E4F9_9LAMI|nr:unnamed protein product [Fraxinus pennsylvanica]